jgi:sec-independent protein translocase protein TatC
VLLSLPVILHQAYSFVLPALSPGQRRVALPVLLAVPALLIAGVVFSYLVVLPAAASFLLNFNASEFQIEIRAREYYGFVIQTLIAVGLSFQVPVAILAATRLGITSPAKLRSQRKLAVLVIAVAAMALPGTDPLTMLIEMVPLIALFEVSVALAALTERRRLRPAQPEGA